MDFALHERWTGDHDCVVEVAGELDVGTASSFRQAVGGLVGAGARHLVVDLADTQFLDSSGLGAIVWAEHRLEAVGGSLAAIHVHEPLDRIFAMAGVSGLVEAQ